MQGKPPQHNHEEMGSICQSTGGRPSFLRYSFALEKCRQPKKPCAAHAQIATGTFTGTANETSAVLQARQMMHTTTSPSHRRGIREALLQRKSALATSPKLFLWTEQQTAVG